MLRKPKQQKCEESIFHLQVYNLRRIKINLVVHQLSGDSDFDLIFWKDYKHKATVWFKTSVIV